MPIVPSKKEEDYFKQLELERRKKIEEEKHHKLKKAEREQRKELHYMKCPKCGTDLFEVDYKKVTIDECPDCKGIWLDANELDQIIRMEKKVLNKLLTIFKS
ncbi:MAG: zf-TFIIB domain-containing protein [Oligoflexia bacterium]|nr:zf-TFIIB domain-containing protein [Oligoflexia bacterium]